MMTSPIEQARDAALATDAWKAMEKEFTKNVTAQNDMFQSLASTIATCEGLDAESVAYIKARLSVLVDGSIEENIQGIRELVSAVDGFIST